MLAAWRSQEAAGRGGTCYRLTPDERERLEERNKRFRAPVKSEDEVNDILADAALKPDSYKWEYATVTDFKLAYVSLTRYSVVWIGRALDAIGGFEIKKQRNDAGSPVKMRKLPFPKTT